MTDTNDFLNDGTNTGTIDEFSSKATLDITDTSAAIGDLGDGMNLTRNTSLDKVEEAPLTGLIYGRQLKQWVEVISKIELDELFKEALGISDLMNAVDKGLISSLTNLQSISDPTIGDYYQVIGQDGNNYIWDGNEWIRYWPSADSPLLQVLRDAMDHQYLKDNPHEVTSKQTNSYSREEILYIIDALDFIDKGTLDTLDMLNSLSTSENGDYYKITENDKGYLRNNDSWVEFNIDAVGNSGHFANYKNPHRVQAYQTNSYTKEELKVRLKEINPNYLPYVSNFDNLTPNYGDVRYREDLNEFYFYNGSEWVLFNPLYDELYNVIKSVDTASDLTNPNTPYDAYYNKEENLIYIHNGIEWKPYNWYSTTSGNTLPIFEHYFYTTFKNSDGLRIETGHLNEIAETLEAVEV